MTRIEQLINTCTRSIEDKECPDIASLRGLREAFRCMRELEGQIRALTKCIEDLEKK